MNLPALGRPQDVLLDDTATTLFQYFYWHETLVPRRAHTVANLLTDLSPLVVPPDLKGVAPWRRPDAGRAVADFIPNRQVVRLLYAEDIYTYADLCFWPYGRLTSIAGIGPTRAVYILFCEVAAGYAIPNDWGRGWLYGTDNWRMIGSGPKRRFNEHRWVPVELWEQQAIRHVAAMHLSEPARQPALRRMCDWLRVHGVIRLSNLRPRTHEQWRSQVAEWFVAGAHHPLLGPITLEQALDDFDEVIGIRYASFVEANP